jgi:hypothetical protein
MKSYFNIKVGGTYIHCILKGVALIPSKLKVLTVTILKLRKSKFTKTIWFLFIYLFIICSLFNDTASDYYYTNWKGCEWSNFKALS